MISMKNERKHAIAMQVYSKKKNLLYHTKKFGTHLYLGTNHVLDDVLWINFFWQFSMKLLGLPTTKIFLVLF